MSEPAPYSVYKKRKWTIVSISTLCGSLGPLAANIYIPVMDLLTREFHTTRATINGTVSVFMAIIAVGPLLLSQISDKFGRRPVLLVSVSIYAISNILLAALPASIPVLFTLRVLQGLGASNLAVGVGVVSDITEPKVRGRFISFYMLGPQLGPVLGPLLGLVGAETSWRFNFVILASLGVLSVLLVLLFVPETLRSLVGNGEGTFKGVFAHPLFGKPKSTQNLQPTTSKRDQALLYFRLCVNNSVMFSSISGALSFGGFYAVLVEFSAVLQTSYRFSTIFICLCYICPGVSLIVGSILFGRVSDFLRKSNDSLVGPERRILLQVLCLPLLIAGMILFGWACEKSYHYSVVIVASFLVSFFVSGILITNTTYLSELSRGKPASYVAFGNLLRNAMAAAFVAAIEPMRAKIGYGWAFTVFAFFHLISIVLSLWLLVKGRQWRIAQEEPKPISEDSTVNDPALVEDKDGKSTP